MTREQAIEELEDKAFTFCNFERCVDFYTALNCERCEEALNMAIKALEQEPKRGKWILDEEVSKKHIEPIYICSACKNYEAWGNTEKTPFCPNCGARMESEEQ